MGICEVLTIIFVVLKLIGKIEWTWVQVLIPEFIGIGLYVILIVIQIIRIAYLNKKDK